MGTKEVYYTATEVPVLATQQQTAVFGGPQDLWGAETIPPAAFANSRIAVVFDYESDDLVDKDIHASMVSLEVFFSYDRAYDPEGRPPYAEGVNFRGSCCKGEKIIIVGVSGLIATSDDGGDTWVERESGVTDTLCAIDLYQGVYTVVGENGVQLTSEDGVVWEQQQRSAGHLFSLTASSGRAIAAGRGLTILGRSAVNKSEPWSPAFIFDKLTGNLYGDTI